MRHFTWRWDDKLNALNAHPKVKPAHTSSLAAVASARSNSCCCTSSSEISLDKRVVSSGMPRPRATNRRPIGSICMGDPKDSRQHSRENLKLQPTLRCLPEQAGTKVPHEDALYVLNSALLYYALLCVSLGLRIDVQGCT